MSEYNPCGKTLGHGESCVVGYLCDTCRRIEELESRIHEACEVYAGMEGFIPETAPEGYCLRIINEMYKELTANTE